MAADDVGSQQIQMATLVHFSCVQDFSSNFQSNGDMSHGANGSIVQLES